MVNNAYGHMRAVDPYSVQERHSFLTLIFQVDDKHVL